MSTLGGGGGHTEEGVICDNHGKDIREKNVGFPNRPSFRYGNFFTPGVEKTSKNSPSAGVKLTYF